MIKNELEDFFEIAAKQMQAHYERISRSVIQDPGTAGDEGEENWAKLLKEWLPSSYHVVTKGKILFPDGTTSNQIDVLILKPDYPSGLIDSKTKKYLAHCVIAAFECKLTLRTTHFKKIFDNSTLIKNKIKYNQGTPFRELHSPILYGILAHSYDPGVKDSVKSINTAIIKHDSEIIKCPKEMLDVICVANIGTWSSSKISYIGPSVVKENWDNLKQVYADQDHVITTYILHQTIDQQDATNINLINPIGSLIYSLTSKIAITNPTLSYLDKYYRETALYSQGKGIRQRYWKPLDVYSEKTYQRITAGCLISGDPYNEWSIFFL